MQAGPGEGGYVCAHSSALRVTKKGSRPVPITDKWVNSCGPSYGGTALSPQKDKNATTRMDFKIAISAREADTEGHIVCDSMSLKCPEQANPQSRKQMVGARVRGRGRE